MLYIILILCGIAAGILRGGKASNLLLFKINRIWSIMLAFAIQVIVQAAAARGLVLSLFVSLAVYGASFILLVFGFWSNRHYLGIMAIASGCLLNGVVILLNGGKMPVSYDLLKSVGLAESASALVKGADAKHSLIDGSTRLAFLADVIYLPGFPGIMMRIVSVGDLIIATGLFILVFEVVKGKRGVAA